MPEMALTPGLRVAVIVGSTREGRVGDAVACWVVDQARNRPELRAQLIDLVDYAFPARYPESATAPMSAFAAAVGGAEAFVVVTPEYNRSFPASLKQAIDYAYDEWHAKPVGFVGYGSRSGGVYAVEQLRGVFTELHTVTVRTSVQLNLLGGGVDERCRPLDTDGAVQDTKAMLDQLVWWGRALRAARAAHPYVA